MEKNIYIDSCYFCTTPFQVISAMALAMEENKISDIYIINQFPSYNIIANNLRKQKIFRKVINIDEGKFNTIRDIKLSPLKWLKIIKWYLQVENIAEEIIGDNIQYKKMYFTSQTLISRLVRLYFIKNCSEMEFIQIDEGVGSYFESKVFRLKFLDKMTRYLLFGKRALEKDIKKMLYMPELSQWLNEKGHSRVIKMPYLNTNPKTANVFNEVFAFHYHDMIKEKVIFFDTLREEIYGVKGASTLTRYVNEIGTKFGKQNFIIKEHPREKKDYNPELKKYHTLSMPAEVIYMNMDIENKILISTYSTACVTPKILFDKEPIVILLYKLVDSYHAHSIEMDGFFRRLKQTYRNQERFLIPENESELKFILKKLCKR